MASCCRLVGTVQEERYMHTIGNVPPEMANHRMDIVMGDCYNRSTALYNMAGVTFTHLVSTNQAKLTRYYTAVLTAPQLRRRSRGRCASKYEQVARSIGIWSSKAASCGTSEQQGLVVHQRQGCLPCSNMGW